MDLPTEVTLTDMELIKHFVDAKPADHVLIESHDDGITLSAEADVTNARLELPFGNGSERNGNSTPYRNDVTDKFVRRVFGAEVIGLENKTPNTQGTHNKKNTSDRIGQKP